MIHAPRPMVDAWIEDGRLVLLAPSFERLAVPLDRLADLIGKDKRTAGAFEIDEEGRYLYWPHADVHLGWDQFVQIVDPTAALSDRQKTAEFNRRYGAAIRALREEHGLRQSEVDGVTERHLRRVEHGEQAASKATLSALATAHKMSLDEYLKALASRLGKRD